jgi:hypothetical protein
MLPLGRVHPRWWVVALGALVLTDLAGGPKAPFPVVYAVPVMLAAWYSGQVTGLWLALLLPASRLALELYVWQLPWSSTQDLLLSAMIRISTFTLIALLTFRLSEHERALQRDLTVLQGLLPLCSFCKSIRNERNEWESLETYLQARSGADFSHGVCPACSRRHYPEIFSPAHEI